MLVAALANLPAVPGRPLFVYRKYGHMIETWHAIAERARVARLTPHCCRHGFATELLRRGVDVHTVAWLGGWASAKQVLETYGHAIKRRDITNMLEDLTGGSIAASIEAVAEAAKKAAAEAAKKKAADEDTGDGEDAVDLELVRKTRKPFEGLDISQHGEALQ